MTALTVDEDQLLALIRETGWWRVVIHPTVFERRRIDSLTECWRIVEQSRVGQRGWDYPYVDRADQIFKEDWVQCGVAFGNFIELWRFFQSGQFVHQFAVTEDREDSEFMNGNRGPSAIAAGSRTLSFLNVLYTATEILEFARQLAHRAVLTPAAKIRIELNGMKGRKLTSPQYRRLAGNHTSQSDTICWEHTDQTAALIATAPRIALDATTHILERFTWENVPRQVLEEEQRRFYEKRW